MDSVDIFLRHESRTVEGGNPDIHAAHAAAEGRVIGCPSKELLVCAVQVSLPAPARSNSDGGLAARRRRGILR